MSQPPFSLHSLPKPHAQLCLRVARFMQDLALPLNGQHFLLAFSGGADSTALACILLALAPLKGFSFSAAHLDHTLRPESPMDAAFTQNFCLKHNIPFYSKQLPIAEIAAKAQKGIEETARSERYRFLEETRQLCKADCILLAHHVNDLAEDMLMRLARGASWPALGGMAAHDPVRHLARPLLMENRESLLGLLHHLNQDWQEDKSNADTTYTRNRIRHTMLPLFLQENPAFFKTVRQLWKNARLDEAAFNARTQSLPQHAGNGIFLDATALRALSPADRLRLYAKLIHTLCGHPLSETLFKLDAAFEKKKTGSVFQFQSGVEVVVQRHGLLFVGRNERMLGALPPAPRRGG